MENKQMVLLYLRDALRYTRAGSDVLCLEHNKTESGCEMVIIHFKSGFTKTVDVTADSGLAVMKDVLKAL